MSRAHCRDQTREFTAFKNSTSGTIGVGGCSHSAAHYCRSESRPGGGTGCRPTRSHSHFTRWLILPPTRVIWGDTRCLSEAMNAPQRRRLLGSRRANESHQCTHRFQHSKGGKEYSFLRRRRQSNHALGGSYAEYVREQRTGRARRIGL